MALPDVSLSKVKGKGRKTPTADNISGMLIHGIATVATSSTAALTLGTVVELNSVKDAEGYGITAKYDTTNQILVHHHIDRFFHRCPSGKLFLKMVARTVTLTDMCDKTKEHATGLLRSSEANGTIKQLAVIINPDPLEMVTLSNGLTADLLTAIPKAQALASEEFDRHRPVDILIEGRNFNGTVTAAKDLRTMEAPQVSVVIGADYTISHTAFGSDKPFQYYAAVGDALGCVAAAKVNECIGWVDKFPLTDLAKPAFVKAGLSSGLEITGYESDLQQLHDKGYIFTRYHAGITGAYWNSSPTASAISGTGEDEAYIESSRALNKAARILRSAYLPVLNSPVPLTADGKMQPATIGAFESLGEEALNEFMLKQGEISDLDVYINPEQVFLTSGETIDVEFFIVRTGVARGIRGKLSLVPKL